MIDSHIVPAFGKDEPRAITRNRVEIWHGRDGRAHADRCQSRVGVLSSFLSWMEHDRKIDRNPCGA